MTFDNDKKQIQNEFAQDFSSSQIVQTSEMGDLMTAIYPNEDNKNIKMLGNVSPYEEVGVLGISALAEMGIMPKRCQIVAMEKLRLSVSRNGRGRDDAVNINRSRLDNDGMVQRKSIADSVAGLFGGGKK